MAEGSGGGGRPAWLADDASIKVDINGLDDFATRIQGEMEKNFTPSIEAGIKPMMAEAARAPFGEGGLREGQAFKSAHNLNLQAVGQLLGDVSKSLQAIHLAAAAIAREYGGADALSKATFDDVMDVFTAMPAGGSESAANAPEGQVTPDLEAAARENVPGAEGPPADVVGGDAGVARPPHGDVIAAGQPGEYHISGDNEGVESRNPAGDFPRPPRED